MNSPIIQYATVRDHENDLVYDGWINFFSDDGELSELLLRDVSVYRNSDAELLYSVGAVYLSFKREGSAVEFRDVPLSAGNPAGQSINSDEQPNLNQTGDREEGWSQSSADECPPATATSAATCKTLEPSGSSSVSWTIGIFVALSAGNA